MGTYDKDVELTSVCSERSIDDVQQYNQDQTGNLRNKPYFHYLTELPC